MPLRLVKESIREDAGETTIEVKVSLTDASVEDETVGLAVLAEGADLPSGDTVTGTSAARCGLHAGFW